MSLTLATGAGKTTMMAMLIAWQTVNAVRRPGSQRISRGFLVVTPGITIRGRLRVQIVSKNGAAEVLGRGEAAIYCLLIACGARSNQRLIDMGGSFL